MVKEKISPSKKAIFDQKRLMVFCHQRGWGVRASVTFLTIFFFLLKASLIVLLDSQFEDVWETKVQRLDELDIKVRLNL